MVMKAVEQTVDLSLSEALIPVIVHVKQYDNGSRKIACTLYQDAAVYEPSSDTVVSCTGTRPDGHVFQYSSETDGNIISLSGNVIYITVTEYMTASRGKVPVDVRLLDGDGAVLGAFSFILRVERAALENKGLSAGSYLGIVSAVTENLTDVSINDDGYICIESDDGLGLTCSMDDDGVISIEYGGE